MEKENIEYLKRKLNLDDEIIEKIIKKSEELGKLVWPDEQFKNMQSQIKLATIIIFDMLIQNDLEFRQFQLRKLLSLLSQKQQQVQFTKKILKNVKNVIFQQKLENPLFDTLYQNFTYLYLKNIVLIKIEQKEKIPSNLTKKVWVFFCRAVQLTNKQQEISKEKISEFCSTLVVKLIFIDFLKYEFQKALEKIPEYFGFKLDQEKYQLILNELISKLPQIETDMPEMQLIEKDYIEDLGNFDIDYLKFFQDQNSQSNDRSITLTPLMNKDEKENKKFTYNIQNFKNISFHSNLKKIVGVINFPEKQLKSPLLKEKFQSKVESFIEISQKFNWYKRFTQDINMIILTINKTNYKVAECCSQYLQIKKIRNNFHSVMEITKKLKIKPQRESIILKTFFKLLSKFMEQEFKKSKRERVQSLYEDDVFMKSLFCFCLVLNEFINYQNQNSFQTLIKTCQITYYYFWIILIHFASEFGDQVPLSIKKFIIELDYKILFSYLWLEKENGKSEGDYIVGERPKHSVFLIEALIRKLGERIFLITNKIYLSDEIKEQIWQLTKSFIFNTKEENHQSIQNIHLDQIVLLSIYYLCNKTNNLINLDDLLNIYHKQVLMPHQFEQQQLKDYYEQQFRSTLKKIEQNNENSFNSFLSPNRMSRNKERIHFLVCSPLIDNLNPNLVKKDMSFYSSGTFKKKKNFLKIDNIDFDYSQKNSRNQSRKMSEVKPYEEEQDLENVPNEIPKDPKFSFANLP